MNRRTLPPARLRRALLAGLLALAAACADEAGPGIDLERMMEQPRYEPYEAGPFFPDDRVLQHPPEGTVSRDRILGPALLTRGEAAGEYAGEIPMPVSEEVLEVGRRNFRVYCAACHGAGGYGGSMVAINMQPPLPASLVTGHGAAHSPGYYFHVITEGTGRMPSYAAELDVAERWAVVAYLTRVLQQPHPLSPAEARDSARAERLRARYPEARARGDAEAEAAAHEHEHTHADGGGHEH